MINGIKRPGIYWVKIVRFQNRMRKSLIWICVGDHRDLLPLFGALRCSLHFTPPRTHISFTLALTGDR